MNQKIITKTAKIKLKIPQMGEGLRKVTIVKFLKNPGDSVKEDEIIYEMETEKSLVEIESPHEGKLDKWLVKEGEILEVGTTIGLISLEGSVKFK